MRVRVRVEIDGQNTTLTLEGRRSPQRYRQQDGGFLHLRRHMNRPDLHTLEERRGWNQMGWVEVPGTGIREVCR